jgi:bifunctional UDP-N-acetylglucosamine pyrophosphorylase / glucosamine-1-phosphate N-acetyltransferase
MMFEAHFAAAQRISSQPELTACFGTDRITLAPGASLALNGTIIIGSEVAFAGACALGDGTNIGSGSQLTDTILGIGNEVRPYSIMTDTTAGDNNLLGPFCFLRDKCIIGDNCIVGAHVEATRSRFGSGAKISHRAFIGDAEIGEHVIIGAGVVFCNWDGQGRQQSQVGAETIIGSGSLIVPPIHLGEHVVIAAGSTVTKDVPAGSKVIQKRV